MGKREAGIEAETMEDLCLQAARKKRKMSASHVSGMLRVLLKLQKFTIILNESSAGWLMGTMEYRCEMQTGCLCFKRFCCSLITSVMIPRGAAAGSD